MIIKQRPRAGQVGDLSDSVLSFSVEFMVLLCVRSTAWIWSAVWRAVTASSLMT
jgi:hypothetical protein